MSDIATKLRAAPAGTGKAAREIIGHLKAMSPEGRRLLMSRLQANVDQHDAFHHFDRLYPSSGALSRDKYPHHLAFFAASEKYAEIGLLGSNRSGKSTCAAYALTAFLTGKYPDFWRGRRFPGPVSAWAAGTDTKSVRESLQSLLLGPEGAPGTGLLPLDSIVSTTAKAGTAGAVDTMLIRHISGGTSRLALKSYDQRRPSFQAAKCHVIWLDEEPDVGIYSECLARLAATEPGARPGLLMCTFTPLLGISAVVLRFMPGGRPKETTL